MMKPSTHEGNTMLSNLLFTLLCMSLYFGFAVAVVMLCVAYTERSDSRAATFIRSLVG